MKPTTLFLGIANAVAILSAATTINAMLGYPLIERDYYLAGVVDLHWLGYACLLTIIGIDIMVALLRRDQPQQEVRRPRPTPAPVKPTYAREAPSKPRKKAVRWAFKRQEEEPEVLDPRAPVRILAVTREPPLPGVLPRDRQAGCQFCGVAFDIDGVALDEAWKQKRRVKCPNCQKATIPRRPAQWALRERVACGFCFTSFTRVLEEAQCPSCKEPYNDRRDPTRAGKDASTWTVLEAPQAPWRT